MLLMEEEEKEEEVQKDKKAKRECGEGREQKNGNRRNVSRPLARIHSTNQHTQKHLLPKSGYKEAYGWKVINPNRVLETFTFDLI